MLLLNIFITVLEKTVLGHTADKTSRLVIITKQSCRIP